MIPRESAAASMTRPIAGAAERLAVALEAAAEAGAASLKHFGKVRAELKADGTEVTIADREAELLIRRMIAAHFPGDGVLGEELEASASTSGWRWIIDPIDGTFSFVRGVPLYATLIAAERLNDAGEPVRGGVHVGVLALPGLHETVYAVRGGGAWHRYGDGAPVRARVSTTATLANAVVNTTSPDYFRTPTLWAAHERVRAACAHMRGWSDAYGFALLATGRCDGVVEPMMKAWDAGPMEPIVVEAGGRATDWTGVTTVHGGDMIASNGLVHDELLATVSVQR